MVVNAFEMAFFFKIQHDSRIYNRSIHFPVPSGYLLDSSFLPASAAHCFLLRLTSDACPYCHLDQPEYKRLVAEAQKDGCKVVTLAAKLGQVKPNGNLGGIAQLQFVDINLGQALNPYSTPQTILLNSDGKIAWDREGSIDPASLSEALHALTKIG